MLSINFPREKPQITFLCLVFASVYLGMSYSFFSENICPPTKVGMRIKRVTVHVLCQSQDTRGFRWQCCCNQEK